MSYNKKLLGLIHTPLLKAEGGGKVKPKRGQNVIIDGKKMNTYSDEYENAYKKGIGQWVNYDQASKQWRPLPANLPNSAYKNAEFISGVNELPEVTVTGKMNPNVVAARKKAKEQAGSYEDYVKREQSTVPKWAGAMGFDNKEADKKIYDENYNKLFNTRTYQNLVDAIPQREGESRIDYMNRFDQVAGKNSVARARTANVTEPFDPGNWNKLKQWAWKGFNHIGPGQALSAIEALGDFNPNSIIQKSIDRGNLPVSGMTADEAKEVGIMQPFESLDDFVYQYGFKPALMAGDNLMDPAGKQARAFNSRNLGASDTDKMFTSILNPINYISGSELLNSGRNLSKVTRLGEGLETAGKFLTEQTPLRNTYKINPFSFKPKSDAAYRMLGNEGYADALNSGVIRPPKGSNHDYAYYNKGYPLDKRLRDATGRAGYEGPYMAEVNGMPESFVNENVASYTGPMFDDPVIYSKNNISINNPNVKLYKENWLQGYKEVPKQRVTNRSSLKSYTLNRQDPVRQTVYNPETGSSVHYDVDGNIVGNSKKLTTNEVKTFNQGIESRPISTGATPPPPEGMAPYFVADTDRMMSANAEWLESPEYLSRRMASTGETASQVKADVAKILAEGKNTKFVVEPYKNTNIEGLYTRSKKPDWFHKNVLGQKDIPAEVSVKEGLPLETHMATLDHEIKHAMSQSATNNNYKGYPTIKVGNWFERNVNGLGTHAVYLNKAPEQQVRYLKILEDIEKSKGIPKGEIITPKQFDDWVETRYNPFYSKGPDQDVIDLIDNVAKRHGKNTRKVLLDKLNQAYLVPGAIGVAGVLGAQQKAEGGPIVDPMGQWAHPGEITRILGNSKNNKTNITMKNVNYPVLGIGSNGQQQMMYPEQEYEFGGASYVDEYPMMGKGGEMIRRADGSYSRRGLWDNIRANKGSGKKPSKEMLEQEKKIKAKNMANGGTNNAGFEALPDYVQAKILSNMGYGGYYNPMMATGGEKMPPEIARARFAAAGNLDQMSNYGYAYGGYIPHMMYGGNDYMAEGGEPNGGMALGQMAAVADKMNKLRQFISPEQNLDPWIASKLAVIDDSAAAISDYMMYNPEAQGMEQEMPQMGRGGYTVTRSNDRKGKTHKVTGPDGTVKYFGDSKLGQHPKDPKRKAAFYARHKKNLDNNPFFRAFARKTWADGGSTFSGNAWYEKGGLVDGDVMDVTPEEAEALRKQGYQFEIL